MCAYADDVAIITEIPNQLFKEMENNLREIVLMLNERMIILIYKTIAGLEVTGGPEDRWKNIQR